MVADPVDPIRAALVEAMAEAEFQHFLDVYPGLRDGWNPLWGPLTCAHVVKIGSGLWKWGSWAVGRARTIQMSAERALSVVESWQPPKPCPECGGSGGNNTMGCFTCGGSGSLPPDPSDPPGIVELLCEQVPFAPSTEIVRPVYRLRERKP